MKRVTKNNLLRFVDMVKAYERRPNDALLLQINDFIDNVINKDKHYFRKLASYNFDSETLKYLL